MKSWIAAVLMVNAGGAAFAQKVSVEYAHQVDFSKFQTYRWGKNKGQLSDSAEDEHIKRALDRVLQQKGLRSVRSGMADLVLTYQATVKTDQEVDSYAEDDDIGLGVGWGWGLGWGPGWGDLGPSYSADTVVDIRKGDLLVDLADPANKRILFRGYSTGAFHSDPVKEDKLMGNAVEKMFKNFPPKQK